MSSKSPIKSPIICEGNNPWRQSGGYQQFMVKNIGEKVTLEAGMNKKPYRKQNPEMPRSVIFK